jgi:hypothetical protein
MHDKKKKWTGIFKNNSSFEAQPERQVWEAMNWVYRKKDEGVAILAY